MNTTTHPFTQHTHIHTSVVVDLVTNNFASGAQHDVAPADFGGVHGGNCSGTRSCDGGRVFSLGSVLWWMVKCSVHTYTHSLSRTHTHLSKFG
jgi:hypothetical protein